MNRFFLLCCIITGGVILTPCTSFSIMHISNAIRFDCWGCHPDGIGSGKPITPCLDCHKNTSGGYTDTDTVAVQTHSSAVIGDDKYGTWTRECLECHDNHIHNGLTGTEGVLDSSYVFADVIVNNAVNDLTGTHTTIFNTMTINNIYDPDWLSPGTWSEKSGPERGLILVLNTAVDTYKWFEVVNATEDTITIGNNATTFPTASNPLSGQLVYGMLIRHEDELINGTSVGVKFGGPKTMANNDGLGTDGNDSTPDGICQVCHTQTTHWRSDGSEANHFSGWNCSQCHPHTQGFKPVIPLLCP